MYVIRVFAFCFVLSVVLVACYKTAYSRFESPSMSYQYDEPREYCQRTMMESGIEMHCDEGSISIRFVTVGSSITATDLLQQEIADSESYVIEETEGKRSKRTIASLTGNSSDQNRAPNTVAVWPLKYPIHAVATGQALSGYEDEFESIFKNLIVSFEMYP